MLFTLFYICQSLNILSESQAIVYNNADNRAKEILHVRILIPFIPWDI